MRASPPTKPIVDRAWRNRAGRLLRLWLLLRLTASVALGGQATFYLSCTSIAVHPGSTTGYSLSFSAFTNGVINDELAVTELETATTSHAAFGYLKSTGSGSTLILSAGIDVPGLGDSNLDGLSDAFEVGAGMTNVVTVGDLTYPVPTGGTNATDGSLQTLWTRAAGSTTGNVVFSLGLPQIALYLVFTNQFEIFEYRGTLAYTPSAVGDDAFASLVRLGAAGSLTGPLTLGLTNAADLGYLGGTWTNEADARLTFLSTDFLGVDLLKGALPAYYFGVMAFLDGRPQGKTLPQYQVWNVDLYDQADTHGSAVPDLANAALETNQFTLTLRPVGGFIQLSASGPPNRVATLEQATTLTGGGDWVAGPEYPVGVAAAVLTNLPAGAPAYFRLR